jgi:hypothetical protein
MKPLDTFTFSYIETLLWASLDDSDVPLDYNYDMSDMSDQSLSRITADCVRFQRLATGKRGSLIRGQSSTHYSDDSIAGHDFFLTRNHHGSGFWDGDWPRHIGTFLTKLSTTFPEQHVYVGDDGKIHVA